MILKKRESEKKRKGIKKERRRKRHHRTQLAVTRSPTPYSANLQLKGKKQIYILPFLEEVYSRVA